MYEPAQNLFRKEQTANPDKAIRTQSEYYVATIAALLNQDGADALVNNFIVNHPESPMSSEAYLQMANLYFQQGNYAEALEWYNAIDELGVSTEEKARFNFQKGYCLFHTGKQAESKPYFESVQNNPLYADNTKYYLGYIAYDPMITQKPKVTSAKSKTMRPSTTRSEERRVGKECRSRWSPYH